MGACASTPPCSLPPLQKAESCIFADTWSPYVPAVLPLECFITCYPLLIPWSASPSLPRRSNSCATLLAVDLVWVFSQLLG